MNEGLKEELGWRLRKGMGQMGGCPCLHGEYNQELERGQEGRVCREQQGPWLSVGCNQGGLPGVGDTKLRDRNVYEKALSDVGGRRKTTGKVETEGLTGPHPRGQNRGAEGRGCLGERLYECNMQNSIKILNSERPTLGSPFPGKENENPLNLCKVTFECQNVNKAFSC